MIKVVEATAADKSRWNDYVRTHADATPYHNWAWLQSVEQAYGFKPVSWLAVDDKQELVGVLPASQLSVPLIGQSLCALPYCDVGGALADNDEIADSLLQAAMAYMKQQHISKFEHRKGLTATSDDGLVSQEALEKAAKVRMLLPLPEDAHALMASFKSKLRSQIRKAEKNGLTASVGRDKQHLEGFYQVYSRNMRDLGSPSHSRTWFENIVEHYQQDVIIANVYKEELVVGAGIVLFNGDACSIPWASTHAEYNRLAPNMLLYWTLLEKACDMGAKTFDFGRSTPGEGTFRFKQQWGAKPALLDWQIYRDGHLQSPVAITKNDETPGMRQKVEKIWRQLPVPVATRLGSLIRKYISL